MGGRTDPESNSDFVVELENAIREIEDGDRSASFGAKDKHISALLESHKERPEQMHELFEKAQSKYDGNGITYSGQKSDLIRMLLLVGLQNADESKIELLRSAAALHARRSI